jgi:hypothetical protein
MVNHNSDIIPALMMLGWFERLRGRAAGILVKIGGVSFFYYVVHLYLIHAIAVSIGLWQGFSVRDMTVLFLYCPATFGVSLGGVYLVWGATVLTMYPACAWFTRIKARRGGSLCGLFFLDQGRPPPAWHRGLSRE